MAITKIEIVNNALRALGVERINSLDDNQPRAKIMKEIYDLERKATLEDDVWPFARKRVELTPLVGAPVFGWKYKFNQPADWIRGVSEYNSSPYEIEGTTIVSDAAKLQFIYIYDIVDVAQFPAGFAKALSMRLAAHAAYALLQKETLRDRIMQDYRNELGLSKHHQAAQQPPVDISIDDFITVRF